MKPALPANATAYRIPTRADAQLCTSCLRNGLQRAKKTQCSLPHHKLANGREKLTRRGLLRAKDRRDALATHTITNALIHMASMSRGKCEIEDYALAVVFDRAKIVYAAQCTRFDYVIMSSDDDHYITRAHTRSHAVEKKDEIIFLRPLHLCRHCGLVYGFERFQSIVCVITGNGPISRLASSVSLTEIHSERTPIYRIWYLEHFSPCDEWILRCFSVSISICGLHFCFKRSDRSKDIALVIALICCTLFSD